VLVGLSHAVLCVFADLFDLFDMSLAAHSKIQPIRTMRPCCLHGRIDPITQSG